MIQDVAFFEHEITSKLPAIKLLILDATSTEYDASEHQFKNVRDNSYDQMKYQKEQFVEHRKEKKRVSDQSLSPVKKSRAVVRGGCFISFRFL